MEISEQMQRLFQHIETLGYEAKDKAQLPLEHLDAVVQSLIDAESLDIQIRGVVGLGLTVAVQASNTVVMELFNN
jgi:hypothetical protein